MSLLVVPVVITVPKSLCHYKEGRNLKLKRLWN